MSEQQDRDNEIKMRAEREGIERYRDLLTTVGEIRVWSGLSKASNMAVLGLFNEARESKAYKGLPHTDKEGNQITIRTLEQFCCEVIGISYRTLCEAEQRLKSLGEDAFIAITDLGLKRSQLRLVDKLPDDEKAKIRAILETKDKDEAAEIIRETLLRSEHEAERFKREGDKLRDDYQKQQDANEKLLADKNKKIDELNAKLHLRESSDIDARATELSGELHSKTTLALSHIGGPEAVIQHILEWDDAPQHLRAACSHAANRLQTALNDLRAKYFLADLEDSEDDDAWMEEAKRS